MSWIGAFSSSHAQIIFCNKNLSSGMLIYVTVSIKRSSVMKNVTIGSMTRGKLEAVSSTKHSETYSLTQIISLTYKATWCWCPTLLMKLTINFKSKSRYFKIENSSLITLMSIDIKS